MAIGGGAPPACTPVPAPETSDLDALPRLVAVADARVGDFDDPDLGFSRVWGVDVDRDGFLYVLEAVVPEIRVYTDQGELVRRIGQRGGGPGEFETPPRFGVVGDTVWAVEGRANRITLFDREGRVLGTGRTDGVEVPLPSGYAWVLPWEMRPDGRFASHPGMVSSSRDTPPAGFRPGDPVPVPFVLFDASGAVTDTVGWAPRPPPRLWRPPEEDDLGFEMVRVGDRQMMVPPPPTTLPWWLPLGDGYVTVETPQAPTPERGEVTVRRMRAAGDTLYVRTLHYRPVRYSSAELDTVAARAARGAPGGGVAVAAGGGGGPSGPPPGWEQAARVLRAEMRFPDHRLPILSAQAFRDGSVWLRRTDDGTAAEAEWITFDPEGRPRGVVVLPSRARPVWFGEDRLWTVEPDALDVEWLVRYRIESP